MVKNLPITRETRILSLGQEDPWRRKWQPTPVFLAGESHGQRSLVGYRPQGRKESDVTEQLNKNNSKTGRELGRTLGTLASASRS